MSGKLHAEGSANTEVTEVTEGSVEASGAAQESTEGGSTKAQGDEGATGTSATEGDPTPGSEGAEGDKPAAFKPRDKFKVMILGSDEQKEHDVPEWLKKAIGDPDTEKQAIELLEKAYGLEPVKTSRMEIRKERDHFKTELGKRDSAIQDVRAAYQRGDIDLFLDKLAIPHERMLQWALDKVNFSQLPEDQQRHIRESQEAKRQAYDAEKRAEAGQHQVFEQHRQAKATLLQAGLARPDVSSFAQAYDAKVGKPGAFNEAVVAEGQLAWIQSDGKEDLTPDQAIERAMSKWKNFLVPASAATQAPGVQAPGSAAQPATTQAKPPVIPNVQGRTSSPMKSKPRSVEDLKKLRDQANAG